MPDGTVFNGGGGLCGATCAQNHWDAQIYSPPYLFNSDGSVAIRPAILSSDRKVANGAPITVTTDGPVQTIAMVRVGSATHTVDTDQRRMVLPFVEQPGGKTFGKYPTALKIPARMYDAVLIVMYV